MTYRIFLATFAFVALILDLCVFFWTMRSLRKDQQEQTVLQVQMNAFWSFAYRKLTEVDILYAESAAAIWFFDLLDNGLLSKEEYDNLIKEMGFLDV